MLKNIPHVARTHRFVSMVLVCFIATSAALSLLTVALAQSVTPTEITLREGGKASQPIVVKNSAGADASPTLKSFTEAGFAQYDPASKTFSPIKAGTTTAKMEITDNGQTVALPDINITVRPKIETYTIAYEGTEYKSTEAIRISQGRQMEVKVSALNAAGASVEDVEMIPTVKQGSTDKLEISSSKPLILKARSIGTATLNVKTADDDDGQDFTFQILPPIASSTISTPPVSLAERSSKIYTPVLKTTAGETVEIGDKAYGVRIELSPNNYVKLESTNKLTAQMLPDAQSRTVDATLHIPAVSFSPGSDPRSHNTPPFTVEVVATGTYMYFQPPNQPLFPGGTARIDAYFRDRNGAPTHNYQVTEWTVDQQYADYVALVPEGNSVTVIRLDAQSEDALEETDIGEDERSNRQESAEVRRKARAARRAAIRRAQVERAKRPNVIPIRATARAFGDSGVTIPGVAYVQFREITKFQPLSVKLNVMDETTAKDLYGGVAANEYYILMVRLFNDLRDDETKRYTGASIIVYSGSVEVAVNLEKQYDKRSNSAKRKSSPTNPPAPAATGTPAAAPTPNPAEGYVADGRWYEVDPVKDMRDVFADPNYVNKSPKPEEITLGFGDDPVCVDTITYRPLMFEMVVNTVDRREGRSLRSKIFDGLELVGIGASFSSAIRFPRPGRDLPIISDRFTNLLVPGLEKVFPSLKEQHRQNIVSQVMKPIEEVPFGSDVTRVLFIPKRPLRGMIPDHKVRISQICPYYFKIKVAVVDKTGQTVVEQGVRR
jgi:hypothetical protein